MGKTQPSLDLLLLAVAVAEVLTAQLAPMVVQLVDVLQTAPKLLKAQ